MTEESQSTSFHKFNKRGDFRIPVKVFSVGHPKNVQCRGGRELYVIERGNRYCLKRYVELISDKI